MFSKYDGMDAGGRVTQELVTENNYSLQSSALPTAL
ncbi:MAG: hypothetical protein ACJASB_000569 [Shewanella psychromarinicola]|jgi:hypothetical protein